MTVEEDHHRRSSQTPDNPYRSPVTSDPEHVVHARSTFIAFSLWVVSSLTFLALIWTLAPKYTPVFAILELHIPTLTAWLLDLGMFLHAPLGFLIVAGGFAATLVPFLRGSRGAAVKKLYMGLAVLGLLSLPSVWLGLEYPVIKIKRHLDAMERDRPMPPAGLQPR